MVLVFFSIFVIGLEGAGFPLVSVACLEGLFDAFSLA